MPIALEEAVKAARPGLRLEQQFYTSEAVPHQDLSRIFGRTWLYAGHIARIPNSGDYSTVELGGERFARWRLHDLRQRQER